MKIKLERHPGCFAVIEGCQCYWNNKKSTYRGHIRFYEGKNPRSIFSHTIECDRLTKQDALEDAMQYVKEYELNQ